MTAFVPFPLRRAARPRYDAAVMPIAVAGLVAGLWPCLIAWPVAGGPAVALAAGLCGWRLASAAAPPFHANDNTPRAPPR